MTRLNQIIVCISSVLFAGTAQMIAADFDGDGVTDEFDICNNTPDGPAVDYWGRPYGDFDQDCDVDLGDFAFLADSLTGSLPDGASAFLRGDMDGDGISDARDVCDNTPGGVVVDYWGRPYADFNHDCSVDLDDFAFLQHQFTGALSTCSEGQPCDDEVACTINDTCAAGVCVGEPVDSRCDDGLYCNGEETCDAQAGCVPAAPTDCSLLDDQCNVGICDEELDSCVAFAIREGEACDDTLFCTTGEICSSGVCGGGTATDCGALDDDCNQGTCSEESDSCVASAIREGEACDDALFCTTGETCSSGICGGGASTDCSVLDDECNQGLCDEDLDSCVASAIHEGEACDDALFCTTGESCSSGVCGGGAAMDCGALDDDCNEGVCDDDLDSCVASAIREGEVCDDTLFCTTGEICSSGVCGGGAATDCGALDDDCNQGICDEDLDSCVASPIGEGEACDDTLFCTTGEICSLGVCGGGAATDCGALDDDCNQGICDEDLDSCVATAIREGESCDDTLFCTTGETCSSGVCGGGAATDCSALDDDCNQGICDDDLDSCLALPVREGEACDDDLFCTTGETCSAGACGGGATRDCSALDDHCNLGVCDEDLDSCVASPVQEGETCDDGLFCTTGEVCTAGSCVGGAATDCAALDDVCQVGVCDEDTDQCETEFLANGTGCDDGSVCTFADLCADGDCVGVAFPDRTECDDGDPTTDRSICVGGHCVEGEHYQPSAGISYSCPLGGIFFSLSSVELADDGVTLTVFGAPAVMTGQGGLGLFSEFSVSGSRTFDGCTETYFLDGQFSGGPDFVGTFRAQFTGCGACAWPSWPDLLFARQ